MTINLRVPELAELHPKITVVGIGGAGGNAVNNMIEAKLGGVEFVTLNTDSQSLAQSLTDKRIQLGVNVTEGLGAGSNPEVGRSAAEESLAEIMEMLSGSHMVFITAGMGGGTGSGASPLVAQAAREAGILTVGVVTKPFQFEGAHRMAIAEAGTKALENCVDTLIVIPNQNLFRVANDKTTFADAFKMADDVLYSGVRSVTDLMVMPGLINLDFADVRSIMMEMGKAMMGTGEAEGDRRAVEAAEAAIANPLLDDVSMKGAKGVLINITGGPDMTLYEVDEAANRIRDEVDPEANIIFGSIFEPNIEGRIRVSVVATGIEKEQNIIPTVHTLYPNYSGTESKDKKIVSKEESLLNVNQSNSTNFNLNKSIENNSMLNSGQSSETVMQTESILKPSVEQETVQESSLAKTENNKQALVNESNSIIQNSKDTDSLIKEDYKSNSGPVISEGITNGNVALEAYPEMFSDEIEKSEIDETQKNNYIENKIENETNLDYDSKPFVPPPPLTTFANSQPLSPPEPFAEAAIVNAGNKKSEKKHKSDGLFEKISNANKKEEAFNQIELEEKLYEESSKSNDSNRIEPSFGLGKKEMASDLKNKDVLASEKEPHSKKNDVSQELPKSPDNQDLEGKEPKNLDFEPNQDLLDIPAFLRRQAN